eukprot:CAMPEP_0113935164 /NCGR_PEP_ID=MMETSP1339-20121228/2372_1 /TAXON_ID=94617 /ORGANISM="Fibrocapsa japonica" /LENGTH=272 /DNA_ID=CAMNT_0000937221 /DNA_START=61 /DNA_END=879 /DNA_ORIENTATION=- /assembly_acc=CAM_ASM_000762
MILHKFTAITCVLAVLISCSSASKPRVTVTVRDTSISSVDDLELEANYEYKISDRFVSGVNYDVKKFANIPSEVYFDGKLTEKKGVTFFGKFVYDLKTRISEAKFTAKRKKIDLITTIDSTWKDLKLEAIQRGSGFCGQDFLFNPIARVTRKGCSLFLDTDISLSHNIGNEDKTFLDISVINCAEKAKVSVSHALTDKAKVTPSFDLKKKSFSYKYQQYVENSYIEAELDAENLLNVKWEDDGKCGKWETSASVPLDDLSGSQVTFKRTFEF